MTCEHRFVAFPGSRSRIYCEFCGVGRDAFAETERAPRRGGSPRRSTTRREQTEAPQTTLFPADPDTDAAREALAEAHARRELEQQLRAIVDTSGLPEDEADEVMREAMDFGPALDLDNFAAQIAAMGERRPTQIARDV